VNNIDTRRAFLEMSFAMFNDENGVSEQTYQHWLTTVESLKFHSSCVKEFDLIRGLLHATDGRYYLPVGFMSCKDVGEFVQSVDIANDRGNNGA
jgi:hypothetical protein